MILGIGWLEWWFAISFSALITKLLVGGGEDE